MMSQPRRAEHEDVEIFCYEVNVRIDRLTVQNFKNSQGRPSNQPLSAEAKARRRAMKDHHINVFYNDDDDGYIADIPDLQHCSAFGATPEEALQEVLKAKQVWLEAAQASGKPIPAPWYRPVMDQTV